MSGNTTISLRKMSLRRAIWGARMAAKAIQDYTYSDPPERHATDLLRTSVKQQLRAQPLDGFVSGIYGVDDEWRMAVLKRDPHVVIIESADELKLALAEDGPAEVLATRQAYLSLDRLRELCPMPLLYKTVFVES